MTVQLFDRITQPKHQEKVVLVHVNLASSKYVYSPEELKELALSAGAEIVAEKTFQLNLPNAKLLIGSGQAEEIAQIAEESSAELIIFGHSLSPSQERNLNKICKARTIDRVNLILDIFALRAQTHEGRLQVELAQLQHLSSRLVGGWTHLERQKGGIGLRGPGETQLESDRRMLAVQIKRLQAQIEKIKKRRREGRKNRQKKNIPCVALVGYTNAGKSTLFNTLCESNNYASDQLFATLDTAIRRIQIGGMGACLIIDTVGFIQNLPHQLIAAFRSTLEETIDADLLLHVIDVANPNSDEFINSVEETLQSIGAESKILKVFNKVDQLEQPPAELSTADGVFVSATQNIGIQPLQTAIAELLQGEYLMVKLQLPNDSGKLRSQLFDLGKVLQESISEDGFLIIDMQLSRTALNNLKKHPEIIIKS